MTEATTGHGDGAVRRAALDALHEEMARHNLAPYWAVDPSVDHDEDRQVMDKKKAIPFVWKYKTDLEPLLYRSAELVKLETSDRRSIVLVNPGLAPRYAAASTLYIAYRLNVYDDDGVTVLSPRAGAPHSDDFKVASRQGVSGFKPYIDGLPKGRCGAIDLKTGVTDTGQFTVSLLDARTTAGDSDAA